MAVATGSADPRSLLLRHWHFGRQVLRGPDYDHEGQLENPLVLRAILMKPDNADLLEWARTCCSIGPYEGCHPLGGWSPGRSVLVTLHMENGDSLGYYYELFDGPGECDVQEHHTWAPYCTDLGGWRAVWDRFLLACFHFELAHLRPGLVMDVANREIACWHDMLCVEFAEAVPPFIFPTTPRVARHELRLHSRHIYQEAVHRGARLLDARVFALFPELVVEYIVQRSQLGPCWTTVRFSDWSN